MKKNEHKYQFTAMPVNLTACMDNNCRSTLFTLLQLSSYYADEDGWFFRSNADLQAQSRLSNKMVIAILSTFHRLGILEVKSVGHSKGTIPNKFRLLTDKFSEWEDIRLEDCVKNPQYHVPLDDYKQRGYIPSYLSSEVQQTSPSTHNIENVENADNTENTNNTQNGENTQNEGKKEENIDTYQGTLGEGDEDDNDGTTPAFRYNVNGLLSQLKEADSWHGWEGILTELDQWIVRAPNTDVEYKIKDELATILTERIAWFKRIYQEGFNSDEEGDFYSQLEEWKEYAELGEGAFSYFKKTHRLLPD